MKTLEETLEEITPTPDPDFVADMERRMQEGFPPKRPPRFSRPKIVVPKFRNPAFAGALASAMLALLVTLSITNQDESPGGSEPQPVETFEAKPLDERSAQDSVVQSDTAGGTEAGRSGEGVAAQPLAAEEVPGTALPPDGDVIVPPVPPTNGDIAPGRRDRKVELTAQMTLAADSGEFDNLADSIFQIADRRNGFVLRSSFTEGEEGTSGGFFELRVPAVQLQPTLNALSRIATVRTRSESGTDVTGNYVAAKDRLRIARAERRSLLIRLENADTDREAAALRQRLEIVAGEITGLRSQLRGIRERTEYAAISVELLDEDAGPAAAKSETDKAFDDAVGSLEDILNFLIRALGIMVPVVLAGAAGWFLATRGRKRQRERTLA
jgi:hypothetical protein